jgi:hypothetical protein
MEVSGGQFHVPVTLTPRKILPVPIAQKVDGTLHMDWTLWRREKSFASVGNRIFIFPSFSP